MNRLPRPRHARAPRALWAVLACSAVLSAGPALAGPEARDWLFEWRPNWIPGDPAGQGWAKPTPQTPGLMVALDRESGLPTMPSPAERRAASAQFEGIEALFAGLDPLPVESARGGGDLVHLQGRFQVFSVARRDVRGKIVVDCASGAEAAGRLLTEPPSDRRRWEEK